MGSLYCTADKIGTVSGGGVVTSNEYRALSEVFGASFRIDEDLLGTSPDPFELDERALKVVSTPTQRAPVSVAHFYAGTFTKTVQNLREHGIKVTYTAAAHDLAESKKEWVEFTGA